MALLQSKGLLQRRSLEVPIYKVLRDWYHLER
jgi:hypothetical protein